jgi:hypothetical protein
METLLNKISTFNIFNYLVPGIVFAFLVSHTTRFNILPSEGYVISLPFFYLCGLLLSSLGSLLPEVLLYVGLKEARKEDRYKNYLLAKQLDPQLEVLAEVRNMSRTFAMMFFVLAIAKVLDYALSLLPRSISLSSETTSLLFFILFVVLGWLLYASHSKTDRRIEDRKSFFLSQKRSDD